MKLAVVDVGNTSTAVGLWSDGRVTCVSHCDGGFAEASAAVGKIASRKGVCALAYVYYDELHLQSRSCWSQNVFT